MFRDFFVLKTSKSCKKDGTTTIGNYSELEFGLQRKKRNRESKRRSNKIYDIERNTPPGMYFCDTADVSERIQYKNSNIVQEQTVRSAVRGLKSKTAFEIKIEKSKKKRSLRVKAKFKDQLPSIEEVSEE